ncbi:MAG: hypothetical protein JWP29_1041 [Rhodoferax sp.]|nr:hypothetical protein [Rhodoferax sp.]
MLDTAADQSEGLRHWMPQSAAQGVRVMAMVSRGEARTEQPLLWQICTSLQGLGHSVAVLDGTTAESDDNPGLQNLLDHAHWLEPVQGDAAWQIVPARVGLIELVERARLASEDKEEDKEDDMPLQPLGALFKNFHVVLVYARADVLISLLPGTRVRPLLAIAPSKNSIVNGYQTLKRLQQQADLMPLLVSLVTGPLKAAETRATVAARSLQRCVQTYLGYQTEVLSVRSYAQHDKPSQDAPRLALRLLESALDIGPGWPASYHQPVGFSAAHTARRQ